MSVLYRIAKAALDESIYFAGVLEAESEPQHVDEECVWGLIELDDGAMVRVKVEYVEQP